MENMTKCIDFANQNKQCSLATSEDGQPRVRVMGFWFADQTGFYFQTGAVKDLYSQLQNNRRVEACFYQPGKISGIMLRIAGEIEFLEDKKLKEKVLLDRPFLKQMGITAESPNLIIFRIAHGQAHFWSMETNLKPKEIIRF